MIPKRYSPNFGKTEAGMSIVEFMVALGLSALISLMIISVALANRAVYQRDLSRTQVNQNVRSALDIIGNEIRQAGERLPSTFPAIELIDNGSGSPDQLVIRRNLLDDSLVGCQNISAGALVTAVALSRASSVGVPCTYANQRIKMNAWNAYAVALSPIPKAYIFNQSTRLGEFLQLTATPTADTGTVIRLNVTGTTAANAYVQEATSLYILNEWEFRVASQVLQIVENDATASAKNVVDQISNFQVQLLMQDGTTLSALGVGGSWTNIQAVRITITGTETASGGRVVTRTLSGDFFPRNILST